MSGKKFLIGDDVTFLDFYFWEMLQAIRVAFPGLYEYYPSLATYHNRMRDLPGMKEYLDDKDCIERVRPFNNKVA